MHKYMRGLYFNVLVRMHKLTQGKDKNIVSVSKSLDHISYSVDLRTMETDILKQNETIKV